MAVQWSGWASLGKPTETVLARPFVESNQDGRLEVFAAGRGEIFNISQVSPNGAWRKDWRSKGRPSSDVGITSHVVGRNADGRLEIFAGGVQCQADLVRYDPPAAGLLRETIEEFWRHIMVVNIDDEFCRRHD